MSNTTYQINSNNNIAQSLRYSRHEYDMNRTSKEKDMLISQLKAKIFELELHEKDYDLLNERYKQLENEFAALNDCMHHLECEKKLRDDEINKHINELQCENENLQVGFSEKLSNNKNLFSQNNILGKQLELKDSEIFNLKNKISELESQLSRNDGERTNLEKVLNGLNDITNSQNMKITQLFQDNKTLKQICEDQDLDLNAGKQERNQMANELDIKNNSLNIQFQNNIKDLERQSILLKDENDNLKNNIFKEKSIRTEENQKNEELSNILNDREQKINLLCHDIETIEIMQNNAENQNNILQ